MIYLDVADLVHIAERVVGTVEVRDWGLLESVAARPPAMAFGRDAYPSVHQKVAALLHSLVRNHALVDGNKRLALAAGLALYGINGYRLTMTNGEAFELITTIAGGDLDGVAAIAVVLRHRAKPRRPTRRQ